MSQDPKSPAASAHRVSELAVTVEPDRGPTLGATVTSMPSSSKADPYIGKVIDGRYLVERVIGEGGMGVVYAGRHKVIDKRVAIKVLRGEMAADQDLNERFLQEARAASAIGNPHIIDISDFGQLPEGLTYFVMELLDGKSLSALLVDAKGPMPVARIYSIAKQIAEGLAAAHEANIVHRDLKPDNVMLINRGTQRDFVKVLDFGIAKVGGGSKTVTRAGSVFGTPHYMSPEQAAGAGVDHRTDIYALGVILYEMASGKVPFDADNFMGILTQHMYKAPVPIQALVPEVNVPPGLDAVVLKCLTKKPEGRYASMGELLIDLDKLERGLLPDAVSEMMARSGGFNVPVDYFRGAMPAPVPASPLGSKKRWPLYALMGAVATVASAIGAVALVRSSSSAAQARAAAPPPPAAISAPQTSAGREPAAVAAPGSLSLSPAPSPEVLISVVPTDATIRRGAADLGSPPVALHFAPGESAVLVMERKGYKAKTVTVDASQPKLLFTLEPMFASPKPAGATTKRADAPRAPLGGIDDVGDPFATKK